VIGVGLVRGRRSRPRPSLPRTRGELLQRIGRGVLWALAVVLLVRGVAGVFATSKPARVVRVERAAPTAWPDDAARVFAADFARAYMTFSPKAADAQSSALASLVSPELAGSVAPELGDDAPAQNVSTVTVARTGARDSRHALITVAVSVSGGTRYVAVPVARDDAGGLVVDELPSFSAPPRRATVEPASLEPVTGPEQGALREVVSRFLRTYLAGDSAGLAYLVPARVRIATPAAHGYELADIDSLAEAAAPKPGVLELLAAVRVRELDGGAVLAQAYRLRLVRRDRWYVADINGSREG
jgi:hypothetical protein